MSHIPEECTPRILTVKLKELCKNISPEETPVFIPVRPAPDSIPMECFTNVDAYVTAHGGRRLLGWRLLQWANILVEGEAHAVWQAPDGSLLDITPFDEPEILFLADPALVYNGLSIMNQRLALTDSPLVTKLIDLHNQLDKIQCNVKKGECAELPTDLLLDINRIGITLRQDVGRNDLCPCQSGFKFKKCCGRQ